MSEVTATGAWTRSPLVKGVRHPIAQLIFATLAVVVVGQTLAPGFASGQQLVDKLTIAAILAVVAAGQNLVILAGREGVDLSVGGVATLGALVAGNVMSGSDSMVLPAALAAALVGLTVGLCNGVGVSILRIPPLVMTLGMAGVVQGVLVYLTNGIVSGRAAEALRSFVTRPWLGDLPGILFIWAAFAGFIWLLLNRTRFGLNVYAVGTNDHAARLAGVDVPRVRLLAYALSGVFAALGGVLLLGYTGVVLIEVGDQYILPSVVAVVLGGTSLAGGSGGYLGTIFGAVFLTLLQSVLITVNMPPQGRQIIFGTTLLAFMLVYGRRPGRS